jgi:hypothetical protein
VGGVGVLHVISGVGQHCDNSIDAARELIHVELVVPAGGGGRCVCGVSVQAMHNSLMCTQFLFKCTVPEWVVGDSN